MAQGDVWYLLAVCGSRGCLGGGAAVARSSLIERVRENFLGRADENVIQLVRGRRRWSQTVMEEVR